jgi:hypothetical protein
MNVEYVDNNVVNRLLPWSTSCTNAQHYCLIYSGQGWSLLACLNMHTIVCMNISETVHRIIYYCFNIAYSLWLVATQQKSHVSVRGNAGTIKQANGVRENLAFFAYVSRVHCLPNLSVILCWAFLHARLGCAGSLSMQRKRRIENGPAYLF